MKTTSKENMILINTGRAWLERLNGVMNLNLNDGEPEFLIADNECLITTG